MTVEMKRRKEMIEKRREGGEWPTSYGEAQAKQMAINHRQLIEETLHHYILMAVCDIWLPNYFLFLAACVTGTPSILSSFSCPGL